MSATGQAAGGDGGQAAQGEGQAQQSGGPDLSALAGTLDQLRAGQDEIRGWFDQQRQQQTDGEQQQTDETPDLTAFFQELDQGLVAPGTDFEAANKHLADSVNQLAQQQIQAAISPLQQEIQRMQRDSLASDLVQEFPELATTEIAERIAGKGGVADQLAQHLGHPELAGDPRLWRVAYMMDKASQHANQSPEGGAAAHLESGNGAGPGAQQQVDRVKQIMEAGGRGSRVLDF